MILGQSKARPAIGVTVAAWLKDNFWLFPLALLDLFIRAYGIADPWLRAHRGFSGALSGIVGRNYLRYGYWGTRLAPVWHSGPASLAELPHHYHLRHPPLRYLTVSVFFRVFGVSEWATTLMPVLFSLGSAIVLYFLVKRLWGKWTALLATAFLTFIPIDAYYGNMACYEAMAMFFGLLALLLYHVWLERGAGWLLAGMVTALGLGALSGYAGYFIIGLIGLHYLLFGPSGRRRVFFAVGLWTYALLIFGVWAGYTALLWGSVRTFWEGWKLRTGGGTEARFTFAAYYALQYGRIRDFFTPVLRLLAVVWAVFFLIDLRRRERWLEHSWVVLLFLYGVANLVVFRQGAWVHEYWLFFLSPFFAVSSAVAVRYLSQRVLGSRKLLVAVLLLLIWAWYLPSALAQLQTFYQARDLAETPLARWLNAHTAFEEGVLLGFEVLQPHFDYYLDRRMEEFDDPEELEWVTKDDRYRWCVLRSPRTVDEQLVTNLMQDYPAEVFQDYIIFDLKGNGERLVRQAADPAHEVSRELAPGVELIGYDGPDYVRLPDGDDRDLLWHYLHSSSYQLEPVDQQIEFVLYWRAGDSIEADLWPRLKLVGDDGVKQYVAETKYAPVTDLYTTGLWHPGEVIAAPYRLELGEDYPPGVYALEVVGGEESLSLGWVTVERGAPPEGRPEPPAVKEHVEMPLGNGATLVGYETDRETYRAGDPLKLRVFWRNDDESEPRSVSGCLRNGDYILCRPMGVIGGPDWQGDLYYEQTVELPLHPAVLNGTYDVMLKVGPKPWEDVFLDQVEISGQKRVWPVVRQGMADWEGDAVLTPDGEFSVAYTLDGRAPVKLIVDWTGRAELKRTRVDAYLERDGELDDYLGTREVRSGEPSRSEWVIVEPLAKPGENILKIRVSPEPRGVHRMGWRGFLERWFPDLLDEVVEPWSGAIQVDLIRVERDWAEEWSAYRDLMRVYAERGMWQEAAAVYEEAIARELRPADVLDLDLLSEVARQTELNWVRKRLSEEEDRLIPNRLGVDFGGKVRLEGYTFQRRGHTVTGRFYFRALEKMDEDWTMWLHGVVEDRSLLTGEDRQVGYAVMDTRLDTSRWEVGHLYEVPVSKYLPEGRYEMRMGLWRWEDGSRLWRDKRPGEHEVDLGGIS